MTESRFTSFLRLQNGEGLLPPFLKFYSDFDHKLRNSFDVNTEEGQLKIVVWWIFYGSLSFHGLQKVKVDEKLIDILSGPSPRWAKKGIYRTYFFDLLLEVRGEEYGFDFSSTEDYRRFLGRHIDETAKYLPLKIYRENFLSEWDKLVLSETISDSPIETHRIRGVRAPKERKLELNGVTLIGHLQGEFGLGDEVRMIGRALDAKGIHWKGFVSPVPHGAGNSYSGLKNRISKKILYSTKIFCLPPADLLLTLAMIPEEDLVGTNIALTYWELDSLPDYFKILEPFISEWWTTSEFVKESLIRTGFSNIVKIPAALEQLRLMEGGRQQFDLPEDKKLILVNFDLRSSIARKNPYAAIEAFEESFGARGDCHLVIKVVNLDQTDLHFKQLQNRVAQYKNISIYTQFLSKEKLSAFISCFDLYVSLHRAEGFGRNLTDSLMLGVPVLATNYSGSKDFLNSKNSFLVAFRKRDVLPGEYVFHKGAKWAEPSIKDAARKMVMAIDDPRKAKVKAISARKNLIKKYSFEKCGSAILKRLERFDDFKAKSSRVVMISHVLPGNSAAGNETRIAQLLKDLTNAGHEVFYFFVPIGTELPTVQKWNATVKLVRKLVKITPQALTLASPVESILQKNERNLSPRIIKLQDGFCGKGTIEQIRLLLGRTKPDIVIAQYVFFSRTLLVAPRESLRVLDLLDLFSTKAKKVNSFNLNDPLCLSVKDEEQLISRADVALAIQEAEGKLVKKMRVRAKVGVWGVYPQATRNETKVRPESELARNFLFVGSNNPMNQAGLRDFLKFSWKRIIKKIPNAKLHVSGKVQFVVKDPKMKRSLIRHGFVKNLAPLYRQADMVINPVFAGTGLKIKTIECLGYARPLVTWSTGVDGLARYAKFSAWKSAKNWKEFTSKCIVLAGDKPMREKMVANSKDFIKEYTKESDPKRLNKFLRRKLR